MDVTGRWEAGQALMNLLESISGPEDGYWNDLRGRVYPKLLSPGSGDMPSHEFPWACLVPGGIGRYDGDDEDSIRFVVTRAISVFVSETDGSGVDTSSAEALDKIQDDIDKAYQADVRLGGAVHRCRPVTSASFASVSGDYGELRVVFELEMFIAPERLGPGL